MERAQRTQARALGLGANRHCVLKVRFADLHPVLRGSRWGFCTTGSRTASNATHQAVRLRLLMIFSAFQPSRLYGRAGTSLCGGARKNGSRLSLGALEIAASNAPRSLSGFWPIHIKVSQAGLRNPTPSRTHATTPLLFEWLADRVRCERRKPSAGGRWCPSLDGNGSDR